MRDDDVIYRIEPNLEGFKAVWGFDPIVRSQKPIYEWTTEQIPPLTQAQLILDQTGEALDEGLFGASEELDNEIIKDYKVQE